MKKIKNWYLETFFIFIILLTAAFLFKTKTGEVDILANLYLTESSPMRDCVSLEDGVFKYELQDTGEPFDAEAGSFVMTCPLPDLPYGVYVLKTHYSAWYDTTEDNVPVVSISMSDGPNHTYAIDNPELWNYKSTNNTMFWVRSIKGSSRNDEFGYYHNSYVCINLCGYGATTIDSMVVEQYKPWRLGLILLEVLAYLFVKILRAFYRKANINGRIEIVGFIVLAVFVSIPALVGDMSGFFGHDYDFHLYRIASIANEISHGHFFAVYQTDAYYGHGYLSNIMYGKIFLYIPALLHLLGVPLTSSFDFYLLIVNIATIALALYSFNGIFGNRKYAWVGTIIYVLSAYRLINTYVRSAVGELTAMVFLPLLVYGLYRVYFEVEKPKFKDCLPLIIAASGLVESHVISVEMVLPFVALFALVHIKTTVKKIIPILMSVFSVVIGNLVFLLPFLNELMGNMSISTNPYSKDVSMNALYLPQLLTFFITPIGWNKKFTLTNEMPTTIGGTLIIGIVLFIICCVIASQEEKSSESHRRALEVFTYGIISMFMTTVLFPWWELQGSTNPLFKIFTVIQFPWRYLSLTTLFLSISTVYAICVIETEMNATELIRKYGQNIILVVVMLAVIVSGEFFTRYQNVTDFVAWHTASGNMIQDEHYVPAGTDHMIFYDNQPRSDSGEAVLIGTDINEDGDREFVLASEGPAEVTLPVTNYDFITVYDSETGRQFDTYSGYNNNVTLKLEEEYEGKLVVSHEAKSSWKIGNVITVLFWGLVLLYALKNSTFFVKIKEDKVGC